MHFISENTHWSLLCNSDYLHNINTHLLCNTILCDMVFILPFRMFSIPRGENNQKIEAQAGNYSLFQRNLYLEFTLVNIPGSLPICSVYKTRVEGKYVV